MLELRTAGMVEMFGKLAWYWEIVDAMKFPPLQMDNPYFTLEQAMCYGRGTSLLRQSMDMTRDGVVAMARP